jgi:hypothetical protein
LQPPSSAKKRVIRLKVIDFPALRAVELSQFGNIVI